MHIIVTKYNKIKQATKVKTVYREYLMPACLVGAVYLVYSKGEII